MHTVDDQIVPDALFFVKARLGEYVRIYAEGHGSCVVSAAMYEGMRTATSEEDRRAFEQRIRGLDACRDRTVRHVTRQQNLCAAVGRRRPSGARSRERSGTTATRSRGSRRSTSRSAGGGDSGPSGSSDGDPPPDRRTQHLDLAGCSR